jgi:peptidoglycan hydrolase-like protein with peptidoglycan-binding domain/cellobiose-specific phosphotransferase system component IIA
MTINTRVFKNTFLLAVAVLFIIPHSSSAATSCSFTKDLQMGSEGEDVRCLQKYLNANGFVITQSGGGAPGNETTEFKSLTQAAVMKWQAANNVSPASGYFGPKSRQAYGTGVSGGANPSVLGASTEGASNAALVAQVVTLKANLAAALTGQTSVVKTDKDVTDVQNRIEDLIDMMEDAQDDVDDIDDKGDAKDAEDSLRDARSSFFDALRAYLDGDYSEAEDLLDDAEGYVDDALDIAGDSGSDVEDDLNDAFDDLDDAWDAFDEAENNGDRTGDAEDYLDEAEDLLNDAEDALDDGDDDEAADLIDEALDLIDDAYDEL